MTNKEVAKFLGVSASWVSKLIKDGRLKVEDGKITKESVDHYVENKRSVGRPLGS